MIINADKGNIEVLGDIQEFKTSIDPKNLEFITTLLSSNLYSDPEQSFIREIVSNAWDSHVEAGTTDIPVIIRFRRDYNNYEISIRDFGTGLSPERFKEVYCNIGSSTKRESNEFIGGFGIGKYSSLACSNTVYITSYYNGTAFLYVMVKSENTITTNLVTKKETKEKNGVEVTIKNISNIDPYRKALKYIVFFPNIYISGIDNRINDTKVKRFKNFAITSDCVDAKILLGNVLYPCNTSLLSFDSQSFLVNIRYSGIVIKFDVGEISITPNRENIIYSSDTVKKIEDRIKATKDELDILVSNNFNKDYKDLYEYYKVITRKVYYSPLDNTYSFERNYFRQGGYTTSINLNNTTFKGSTMFRNKSCIEFLRIFFNMILPYFKGIFYRNKFYQNKILINIIDLTKTTVSHILAVKNYKLTEAAKSWLQEHYAEYTIVTYFNKEEFTEYVEKHILNLNSFTSKNLLINYMYDYLTSKTTVIDLNTNTDFLKYKEELKSNKIPVVKLKAIILYIYRSSDYRERKYFKDIRSCIEFIKSLKKGVILANMLESDSWYGIAKTRGFEFIKARKEIVNAIYELKLTSLVNKEWILKEDPIIIKLHTIIESFKDMSVPTNYSITEMLNTFPTLLKNQFKDIINFYYKYNSKTYAEASTKCTNIDSYTKLICEKFKDYIKKYDNLSREIELPIEGREPLKGLLIAAAIIKCKTYRINSKMYNEVKNNKLLKILCKK